MMIQRQFARALGLSTYLSSSELLQVPNGVVFIALHSHLLTKSVVQDDFDHCSGHCLYLTLLTVSRVESSRVKSSRRRRVNCGMIRKVVGVLMGYVAVHVVSTASQLPRTTTSSDHGIFSKRGHTQPMMMLCCLLVV